EISFPQPQAGARLSSACRQHQAAVGLRSNPRSLARSACSRSSQDADRGPFQPYDSRHSWRRRAQIGNLSHRRRLALGQRIGFMNQRNRSRHSTVPKGSDDADSFIDVDRLIAIVIRRAGSIALCVVTLVALAGVYLLFATPQYTSMTQILLDDSMTKYAE